MASKSETSYAKVVLLRANLLIAVLAYIFLVGTILHLQTKEYVVIGIFGAFLIILAYLGLFSKYKNDDFMSVIFSACLLVIFFAEAALASSDITSRQEEFKNMFKRKMKSEAPEDIEYINTFQLEYKCCGWKDSKDWAELDISLPNSCCGKNEQDSKTIKCYFDSKKLYRKGCEKQYYRKHGQKIVNQYMGIIQSANDKSQNSTLGRNKNKLSDSKSDRAKSSSSKNPKNVSPNNPNSEQNGKPIPLVDVTIATDTMDTTDNTSSTENSTETILDYYTSDIDNSTESINYNNENTERDYFDSTTNADSATEVTSNYDDYEEDDESVEQEVPSYRYSGGGGGGGSFGRFPFLASLLG